PKMQKPPGPPLLSDSISLQIPLLLLLPGRPAVEIAPPQQHRSSGAPGTVFEIETDRRDDERAGGQGARAGKLARRDDAERARAETDFKQPGMQFARRARERTLLAVPRRSLAEPALRVLPGSRPRAARETARQANRRRLVGKRNLERIAFS